jgi:hypothetical protein
MAMRERRRDVFVIKLIAELKPVAASFARIGLSCDAGI